MTVENTPCPAAALGRRIAANEEKLENYDMAGRGLKAFAKIAYDNALEHAYEEFKQLAFALSHEQATSQDGAAVQVAAMWHMITRIKGADNDMDRREAENAAERLAYSALSVLMDRVEADWVTSGVESLAHSMHNPWVAPDIRIKAEAKRDEALRETRAASVAAE